MTMSEPLRTGCRFKAAPVAFLGAEDLAINNDVIIRFSAKTGEGTSMPSGPGRVLFQDARVYTLGSAALKAGNARTDGSTGRFGDADSRTMAIGFQYPSGFDTLNCAAAAEKGSVEKTLKKKTGE